MFRLTGCYLVGYVVVKVKKVKAR